MVRKLESATLRPSFKLIPLPGFHMTAFGGGEYLVINDQDSTNNVIVGADMIAGLLVDLASGGTSDAFQYGYGTMWTVERAWD
jgi:hypothetical protein